MRDMKRGPTVCQGATGAPGKGRAMKRTAVLAAILFFGATGCTTLVGAGIGAGSGAAIAAGTGHNPAKGALIGAGVGAAAGTIYGAARGF